MPASIGAMRVACLASARDRGRFGIRAVLAPQDLGRRGWIRRHRVQVCRRLGSAAAVPGCGRRRWCTSRASSGPSACMQIRRRSSTARSAGRNASCFERESTDDRSLMTRSSMGCTDTSRVTFVSTTGSGSSTGCRLRAFASRRLRPSLRSQGPRARPVGAALQVAQADLPAPVSPLAPPSDFSLKPGELEENEGLSRSAR